MQKDLLILLTVSVLFAKSVVAATFCVTSSVDLQNALTTSEFNGENDTIKIAVGSYHLPAGIGFSYNPVSNNDDNDLTIIGGWTPFFGNSCAFLNSPNPINTTLDGDQLDRVFSIFTDEYTNITIENIQFINGKALQSRGAGLYINSGLTHQGQITITNNAFIGNRGNLASAMRLGGYSLRVTNNLFTANHSISNNVIELISIDSYGIYFMNNTVINNSVDPNSTIDKVGGAYILASGSSKSYIANNIFWGNEFDDLYLEGSGTSYLYNNDIEILSGVMPTFSSENLSVSPDIQVHNYYRLNPSSPLINMGQMPATFPSSLFHLNWSLPELDLEGNSRIQGGVVDIGVFETSDVIFKNDFEIVN